MNVKKILNNMLAARLIEKAELIEQGELSTVNVKNRIEQINEGIAVLCKERDAFLSGDNTVEGHCKLYREELTLRKKLGHYTMETDQDTYLNYTEKHELPDICADEYEKIAWGDSATELLAELNCQLRCAIEKETDPCRVDEMNAAREELNLEKERDIHGDKDAMERILFVYAELSRLRRLKYKDMKKVS
ncbi:hypothetical protein [Sinanaerobacter sp. ZZT-01]|uniref:hypothetical protein n=1 Tax=Sinanaerobacter sp. ZZT-01 TaxID=3111540 RepID=UPI002D787DBC|nr:hypothetical protein [Sinanaerobacter sp. ZZT-01]WRR93365.1 hypothetical protein U5921_15250 [Sinanaerobacter sp. ZZT-01]